MPLQNEVALITGASRGIGMAIALELGRLGAKVIGSATSSEGVEIINKLLKSNNILGKGTVLDVANQVSIDSVLDELEKSDDAPTILVNNAGITRDNLLIRMKEAEWDAIMETDLKSLYRMSKACVRAMIKA